MAAAAVSPACLSVPIGPEGRPIFRLEQLALYNLKKANAYDNAKQVAHAPDGLGLEKLRNYCKAQKLLGAEGDALVELVQQRRNAIHAFKERPIGDGIEFQTALRGYLRQGGARTA